MAKYYLGIDGGGTKTTCAVGDESSLFATAVGGPCNVVRVGEAEARRSLHYAITQAWAAAGINPQQIARTCIGAAGADRAAVVATVRRILGEILSGAIDVRGDMEIALEAAFYGDPGIIVIAGTGSIAYGRDSHGLTARAGGWGFNVSDEGSAHWISRNAVAAVLRAWDLQPGRREKGIDPDSSLYRAVQGVWNVESFDDFVRTANATPMPDFAVLLRAIVGCADAGDEISRDLLARAASELSRLATIVISRLFQPTLEPIAKIRLAMVGGVFRHAALVRQTFYNELKTSYPQLDVIAEVVEPVQGAMWLARGPQLS
ncbi:MAG TPA: BadF/BadG/BcrA/BcrD ATPase family protein [Candidatus Sulfotelmatobacter sp.]